MNIWTDCTSAEELYLLFYDRWMNLRVAYEDISTSECECCGSLIRRPFQCRSGCTIQKAKKPYKDMTPEERDRELLESDIRIEFEIANNFVAAAHGNELAKAWIRHLATIFHGRAYWDGLSPEEQAAIRDEAVSKIKAKPKTTTGKASDAAKQKAAVRRKMVADEYSGYLAAHRAAQFVSEGRITIGPEWEWAEGPTMQELNELEES